MVGTTGRNRGVASELAELRMALKGRARPRRTRPIWHERREPALWRAGGYRSIALRRAPEHGSTAMSPGPDSKISAAMFSAQLMQTPARSIPQPVQLQLDS